MGCWRGRHRLDPEACPERADRVRVYARTCLCACLRPQFFTKGDFSAKERGQPCCETPIRRNLPEIGALLQFARCAVSQSGKVSSKEISSRAGWKSSWQRLTRFRKKRGERIRCEKTPCQGQSQLDQLRSCDYRNKQSPCRSGPCHRSNTSANEAVALYQLRVWRSRSIRNSSRSAFLGYKRSLRLSAGRSRSRLRLSHLRR